VLGSPAAASGASDLRQLSISYAVDVIVKSRYTVSTTQRHGSCSDEARTVQWGGLWERATIDSLGRVITRFQSVYYTINQNTKQLLFTMLVKSG